MWSTKSSLLTSRNDPAATSVGGLVYALGGNNGPRLATVEAYDPTANTWGTKASMFTAREGLVAIVVGDTMYAIGGIDQSNNTIGAVEAGTVPCVGTTGPGNTQSPKPAYLVVEDKVGTGKIIVAPNAIVFGDASVKINLVVRSSDDISGHGPLTVRIFNEAGLLVRTLHADPDGQVYAHAVFDGRDEGGHFLGIGVYWVVAGDGGVKDQKPLFIIRKRGAN